MTNRTVFTFSTPVGAQEAVGVGQSLQRQDLIYDDDYATVSWPLGDKKPQTKLGLNTDGSGALDGT